MRQVVINAEFYAGPDDLRLGHPDQGGMYAKAAGAFDTCAGGQVGHLFEGFDIFRPAIRISAIIYGVCAEIANAVTGVSDGFTKELDIVGIGYRAEVAGRQLTFALGFSHPVLFDIPAGITVTVDKQTHLVVSGVDCQAVGQVAANIRRLRKPDPYKQKGIRYTGEILRKKVGKTGA